MKAEIRLGRNNCSVEANQAVLTELDRKLSRLAPGAIYMHQYKLWKKTKGIRGWNGKIKFLSYHDSGRFVMFPAGFVTSAHDLLHELGIDSISVKDMRFLTVGERQGLSHPTVPLRDYQTDAINAAFSNTFFGSWWPRGVIHAATGSGKSEIAVAMYQMHSCPTVFLVHRKDLLYQAHERFKKYGITTGLVGDGIYDPHEEGITVATVQSLLAKQDDILTWSNNIEQLFFDEAHILAANTEGYNKLASVSKSFWNAFARWGLTGTPFMRDDFSNWVLEGLTGRLLYSIDNQTLINRGFLTPAKVAIKKYRTAPLPKRLKWADAYELGIVMNKERNVSILDSASQLSGPLLILVTQLAHAKILQMRAKDRGMDIPIVSGADSGLKRREYVTQMRAGKINAVIATTVFDEGVDIPELRAIILAGGGKSKIKALQRVGRGLRLAKHKNVVEVIDFWDEHHPILKRHSRERLKYWEGEGFEVT